VALWGVGLALAGAAACVLALLLGAVGAVGTAISCTHGCAFIGTTATEASRQAHTARVQLDAAGTLFFLGVELGLLGLLLCALRPYRCTGPNTLRNTALVSLLLAVTGFGVWLVLGLAGRLGDPRGSETSGLDPGPILFLALAAAAVGTTLFQAAGSIAVLARGQAGVGWLYWATLGKLGAYLTVWLLLPFFAFAPGGGAVDGFGHWLFVTGAVALYYWIVLRIGFLRRTDR
jgi:hypothetical protein